MVVAVNDEIAAVLAGDRSELASSSTAERVAGILRNRIMEGLFPPGSRLSEEVLGRALGSVAEHLAGGVPSSVPRTPHCPRDEPGHISFLY